MGLMIKFAASFVLADPIYGAYTELYAGFSDDITMKNNGAMSQYTLIYFQSFYRR